MSDHPVGINLCGSFRIQMHHLEFPEVCHTDGIVLRTHIEDIWDTVVVKVIFACIPSSIT